MWNAMLAAFSRNNHMRKAEALLSELEAMGKERQMGEGREGRRKSTAPSVESETDGKGSQGVKAPAATSARRARGDGGVSTLQQEGAIGRKGEGAGDAAARMHGEAVHSEALPAEQRAEGRRRGGGGKSTAQSVKEDSSSQGGGVGGGTGGSEQEETSGREGSDCGAVDKPGGAVAPATSAVSPSSGLTLSQGGRKSSSAGASDGDMHGGVRDASMEAVAGGSGAGRMENRGVAVRASLTGRRWVRAVGCMGHMGPTLNYYNSLLMGYSRLGDAQAAERTFEVSARFLRRGG